MKRYIDMKLKNSFKKDFNRIFKSIALSLLNSFQTYLFMVIIPFCITIAIYLLRNFIDSFELEPLYAGGLLMMPILTSMFLITEIITEWKNSIFMTRIKVAGISKIQFLSAVLFVFILIDIISFFINSGLCVMVDLFLVNKSFIDLYSSVKAEDIFVLIIAICIISIFCSSISLTISGSLNSLVWAQIINALIIIFAIFTSDFVFNSYNSADNKIYFYIGFASIFKYCSWIIMMTFGGILRSKECIDIMMQGEISYKLFDNLYTPMLLVLMSSIPIFVIANLSFKFNYK